MVIFVEFYHNYRWSASKPGIIVAGKWKSLCCGKSNAFQLDSRIMRELLYAAGIDGSHFCLVHCKSERDWIIFLQRQRSDAEHPVLLASQCEQCRRHERLVTGLEFYPISRFGA
jgi:hypothetical protein